MYRRTEDGKKNHLRVKNIQASSSRSPSHRPHIASMHHQRWLALQAAVRLREGRVCFSPSPPMQSLVLSFGHSHHPSHQAILYCRKTNIYMVVSWVLTTLLQPSTSDLLLYLTSRLSLYSYHMPRTSTLL